MAPPYGATVLEHFRRPRNQRSLPGASASHEAFNPLCGDRVLMEIALDGATITDAAFTANACAICTASASLLTVRLRGVSIPVALSITNEEMIAALGGELPAAREECAILPARAVRSALAGLQMTA
jgi:nitrogen fixation protein NifU and related proteins